MNNLIIEIPNISDQEKINELAVQVHDLHVKWRNDLFIKCDNMMPKERLEDLINQKEILVARLNDKAIAEQNKDIAAERKSQVGTGDRSERIRTYNYPQGRVSDHRINLTLYKLDQFLDGDLDEMIDALITEDQTKKMTAI